MANSQNRQAHQQFPPVGTEVAGWKLADVDRLHTDEYAAHAFMRWEAADGRSYEGFFSEKRPSVMILPITAEGSVILIEHFRHGAREIVVEAPGGLIDDGQTEAQAAKAETLEETGYDLTDGSLEYVSTLIENPAQARKEIFVFRAEVTKSARQPEPGVKVIVLPFAELVEVLAGRATLGAPIEPVSFSALSSYAIGQLTESSAKPSVDPDPPISM